MRSKRIFAGAGVALLALAGASGVGHLTPHREPDSLAPVSVVEDSSQGQSANENFPSEEGDEGIEEFTATAYCDYGITFSGILVRRGIVAADPDILPIGSVIEVFADDYSGIYTVMDTGGLVKGRIIDIYMPDYEEAIEFGRQKVGLRILRHGWHPEAAAEFSFSGAG